MYIDVIVFVRRPIISPLCITLNRAVGPSVLYQRRNKKRLSHKLELAVRVSIPRVSKCQPTHREITFQENVVVSVE